MYKENILPKLGEDCDNKIVAIDIETGEFELADTTLAAAAKMFARSPDAQLWFERVSAAGVHRFNVEVNAVTTGGLIGMGLLEGYKLEVDTVLNGIVSITDLGLT